MWSYLWQNFLIDSKVKDYIANKIKEIYEKNELEAIIEIGPWKCAITKRIFQIPKHFFVIEKDIEMKKYIDELLREADWSRIEKWNQTFEIIMWDVLQIDVESELKKFWINPEKTLIVWNLPYYITSPILRKFFGNWEMKFKYWFFMLQKEVWEKIKSDANKKSYLRWLLNYWYHVEYCKTVAAKCFSPAPKVQSCLLKIEKLKNATERSPVKENIEIFNDLINFLDLFAPFSRKTLWKIQKMNAKKWQIYNIPEKFLWKRLEELDFDDLEKII